MKSTLVLAFSLLSLGLTNARAQATAPGLAASSQTDASQENLKPASPALAANYGKLPLSFEVNRGQSDPQVKFLSRGQGYSLFLTDSAAVLALTRTEQPTSNNSANPHRRPCGTSASDKSAPDKFVISTEAQRSGETCGSSDVRHSANSPSNQSKTDIVRMELIGAAPNLKVNGTDQLPGTANYFIGNDPTKWHSNVSTYAKVKYSAVYPGIDLVYYGNQRQLEYDFVVAPNADPKPVKLHFAGADKLTLNTNGDLTISAKNGQIAFHKPVVYQTKDGQRKPVEGTFALLADRTIGFQLGTYDHSRDLVIDPKLAYSTYLGGSGQNDKGEIAAGIAVDNAGNAYVAGLTYSADYPYTSGASQLPGGYVTKINPTGSGLIYSTYLEGNPTAITVDGDGNAYVAGVTGSPSFPTTPGAFQTSFEKGSPAALFITKLNPAGNGLVYSTLLGQFEALIAAIALNSTGDAYVTGATITHPFPVTSGAFQDTRSAPFNCFVTRLNSTGSALIYSTYLGGKSYNPNSETDCYGIAVDSYDKAYVTGFTDVKDFPVTSGAFQTVNRASENTAFVTKFNPGGSGLDYSTFLGGSHNDFGTWIALDSARNAYVFGTTDSSDFPVTTGAYKTVPNSPYGDNYVAKIDPTGSSLVYSTFFGGPLTRIQSIAVDTPGHVFMTGIASQGFDILPGAAQRVDGGDWDAFLSRLSIDGSALGYSSYFGGTRSDYGTALAVDNAGNAYLLGSTNSRNLIVTPGALQPRYKGSNFNGDQWTYNNFIAKFQFSNAAFTSTQISTSGSSEPAGTSVTFTATVVPISGTWTPTGNVSFRIDGSPYIHVPLDSSGNATYSTDSLTVGRHTITAAYLGTPGYALASDGYAPSSASLIQTVTSQ